MNEIDGYILAGGKSSRMGFDKGLLKLNGKFLIEQIIEKLEPAVRNVIIVSNNPDYKKFGKEVIEDIYKDTGPAGGIHAALSHCSTGKIFITACDMPDIQTEAIRVLISKCNDHEITIAELHGRLEPLFAAYSKTCLPGFTKYISNGTNKLSELIFKFNVLRLKDEKVFLRTDIFTNINTPADIKSAKIKIHGN